MVKTVISLWLPAPLLIVAGEILITLDDGGVGCVGSTVAYSGI